MKALGLLLASQALCLNGRTSNLLPIETSCVPVVRSIALLALFLERVVWWNQSKPYRIWRKWVRFCSLVLNGSFRGGLHQ